MKRSSLAVLSLALSLAVLASGTFGCHDDLSEKELLASGTTAKLLQQLIKEIRFRTLTSEQIFFAELRDVTPPAPTPGPDAPQIEIVEAPDTVVAGGTAEFRLRLVPPTEAAQGFDTIVVSAQGDALGHYEVDLTQAGASEFTEVILFLTIQEDVRFNSVQTTFSAGRAGTFGPPVEAPLDIVKPCDRGVIRVTLNWDTQSDLDLMVTDPNGVVVNASSAQELAVDFRSNGGGSGLCEEDELRFESMCWLDFPVRAPVGTYSVHVIDADLCPGTTDFVLTVITKGFVQRVETGSFGGSPGESPALAQLPLGPFEFQFPGEVDVGLAAAFQYDPLVSGETALLSITATNGPAGSPAVLNDATNLVVDVALDPGLVFDFDLVPPGFAVDADDPQRGTWSPSADPLPDGRLAPGASVTLDLATQLAPGAMAGTPIGARAALLAVTERDVNGANDVATASFTPAVGVILAAFSATPTSGCSPLVVQFTDESVEAQTWSWDLDGDGKTDSSEQNPAWDYTAFGGPATFDVSLTVTGPGGSDTEVKPGLVTVDPSVSVLLLKSVDQPGPIEGQTVTFLLSVFSSGGGASNVTVTDRLPAGLTFASAAPSSGSYDQDSGLWDIGALGYSETLQLRATVDAGTAGQTITNMASATSTCSSGEASAALTVREFVDLAVTKTTAATLVGLDDPVVYDFVVRNLSQNDATNVVVTDVLPAILGFSFSSPSGYDQGTGRWPIGDLEAGGMRMLQIETFAAGGLPPPSTVITNTATVASDEPDSNPANNASSADFTIGSGVLVAPTLSNGGSTVSGLNQCDILTPPTPLGTWFNIGFDYSDPNGDVKNEGGFNVFVNYMFSNGGTGFFDGTPFTSVGGNGFVGGIQGTWCFRFGNATFVDVTVTLTDAGGQSNMITIRIPKPSGAN